MPNLGPGELLVVFLVALIVLGPSKLPEAARQAGKALAELRRLSSGFQDEMREAMREPTPTLPPLPEAGDGTATATAEPVVPPPEVEAPAPPRRRRAPLRADDAGQ